MNIKSQPDINDILFGPNPEYICTYLSIDTSNIFCANKSLS